MRVVHRAGIGWGRVSVELHLRSVTSHKQSEMNRKSQALKAPKKIVKLGKLEFRLLLCDVRPPRGWGGNRHLVTVPRGGGSLWGWGRMDMEGEGGHHFTQLPLWPLRLLICMMTIVPQRGKIGHPRGVEDAPYGSVAPSSPRAPPRDRYISYPGWYSADEHTTNYTERPRVKHASTGGTQRGRNSTFG